MKIEVRQIWEVITDDFLTSCDKSKYKRPIKLFKGENIEIRYPYHWHFRTEDNEYFHAEPEMIIDNCKLKGIIWERIQWNNKAKLEEILRLRLYDEFKETNHEN